MRRGVALLVMALAAGLSPVVSPVLAQQRLRPPAEKAPPPPPAEPAPPVYEPQLLKLAEVLGALSFLSDLCRNDPAPGKTQADSEAWRRRMSELIEAEAQGERQKERLAGAYNRGYAGYRTTYRTCTPSGQTALERLVKDGARLASELSGRFGS